MLMHASCVAYDAGGILIKGCSGSGKSSLALALMAYGAALVSDDQTLLQLRDDWPTASAPPNLRGVIEARGIGLLAAKTAAQTRVTLVVDLDHTEPERLPPNRTTLVLDQPVALLHKVDTPYFAAAILQYLTGGKASR